MSTPTWSAVDDTTASLLDLLGITEALPEEVRQWNTFVHYLMWVARKDGLIDQNEMRPLVRGEVKPSRIGAFYRRAALEGLIRAEGWNESNDKHGRNAGRPTRTYRWLGTVSCADCTT